MRLSRSALSLARTLARTLAPALALLAAACDDAAPPAAEPFATAAGKADAAPIAIVGGLTLEDATTVALPVAPSYVGLVVLAPAGADLTFAAEGKALATRVTVLGPRTADGRFRAMLGSAKGSVRLVTPSAGAYLVVPQPQYAGQSGSALIRATCAGSACLGQCGAAKAPKLAARAWVHTTSRLEAVGAPNHRAYDQVVAPDAAPELAARFAYGPLDKDLEDEDVDLWIRECPAWRKVATVRTDEDGVARVRLAAPLSVGEHALLWVVGGDRSTAPGMVAVWAPGEPVVVTDIDGTLTINDAQIFKDVFLGTDPVAYADGNHVLWTLRRKGYHVQYLTGRPESLGAMTKAWVAAHGFPPGPTRLTDETLEALPTEGGVADFKTRALDHLIVDIGAWVVAGLGNATTDISAYQASDIADDHVFIIGPHGGERGTQAVTAWTALLPTFAAWPEAP